MTFYEIKYKPQPRFFGASHLYKNTYTFQNSNIGGLRQGVGSWEERVKIEGREQGALEKSLGAEHQGKKKQGDRRSIRIAVTKYKQADPLDQLADTWAQISLLP